MIRLPRSARDDFIQEAKADTTNTIITIFLHVNVFLLVFCLIPDTLWMVRADLMEGAGRLRGPYGLVRRELFREVCRHYEMADGAFCKLGTQPFNQWFDKERKDGMACMHYGAKQEQTSSLHPDEAFRIFLSCFCELYIFQCFTSCGLILPACLSREAFA
jgi:hypothetical protein